MTEYQILRAEPENADFPDGSMWREYGTAKATSPGRAVRSLLSEPGIYVAVPMRSWKELTLKVEQTTKITIG